MDLIGGQNAVYMNIIWSDDRISKHIKRRGFVGWISTGRANAGNSGDERFCCAGVIAACSAHRASNGGGAGVAWWQTFGVSA